jgi:uncharacterized protein YbjT (DUF2867 family)
MRKNVLVIGATGIVSYEVLKVLAHYDVNVRLGVRNPDRAQAMELPKVELMQFDYCDPESHDDVFEGIDSWVLISPPANFRLQKCVNTVIDRAKNMGIKQIVNISKLGIQDDNHPMRIIEDHIENSGLEYTFLRPNCYMQYFNTYFRQIIIDEGSIKLPAGNAKTSFVDIRDVAEAAAHLLNRDYQENKTYQLTGIKAYSISKVAELLSEVAGTNIDYTEISEEDFEMLLKLDGWEDLAIQQALMLCRFVRQGWNAAVTSGVFEILGREPRTFHNYVRDYAPFWKDQVLQSN